MHIEPGSSVHKLLAERTRLIESLRQSPRGQEFCHDLSHLFDQIISEVAGPDPQFAVIATGGFGRRELAPCSDIDLTVVPADEGSAETDRAIREFFRDLHQVLGSECGIELGYAYRLTSDAPSLDSKTRSGLMDMRLVCGPRTLFTALEAALTDTFIPGEFLTAKLAERREAFAKFHDTPLVAEPQLKEGAGGLRCFHTANWIRAAIGEQPARTTAAYERLILTRNLLHLCTGKASDLLNRPRQQQIAEILEEDPRAMMSEVCEAMSQLHRYYLRAVQSIREARFPLHNAVWSIMNEVRVDGVADAGEIAIGIALATQLEIGVSDFALPMSTVASGPAALHAIRSGEETLRNLDKCGVLSALLPELAACRTLMPGDPVHRYTVFEHTMRVVRNIDRIDPDSFLGGVRDSIRDPSALYLAALLHDVGKIDPSRPHSEAGAEMAKAVCRRWNLEASVSDTVVWLVREHLAMSRFISIRDIQNPDTAREFAELVMDSGRLGMLTVLTFADISAVSGETWTAAQGTFLKQLYDKTLELFRGQESEFDDAQANRRRLLRQLAHQADSEVDVEAFVQSLPAYYLASTPGETIRLHMHYAQRARRGEVTVDVQPRPDLGASEITVCAPDAPGLLSRILGVTYALDLSIQGIRACTTSSDPSVALDVITASFAGRPIPPATAADLTKALGVALADDNLVRDLLLARGKDPDRVQEVFTYTFHPGAPGILEIRTPRGRGMAFRFSRLIARRGWNVVSARVGQWAGNATAAFYLESPDGRAITAEDVSAMLSVGSLT